MAPDARSGPAGWAWACAAGVLAGAAALRIIGLGRLPPIADEAYYWLWSQRLDWGYWDHPSGMAVLLRLSTALGGDSPWGLRWLNGLSGIAAVALVCVLGRRLFSLRAGLLAAAMLAVSAAHVVTARFVYTDTLHLVLLLLNLWCFAGLPSPTPSGAGPARPRGWRSMWAYAAWGLTLALLLNTKYSAYLYATGLAVAIVWDHRELLRCRRFWGAAVLAAVGLLPALWWNATHDWGSWARQLAHALSPSPGASYGGSSLGAALSRLAHAWQYLTWPVVLAALLGLGRWRCASQRLLGLPALAMLLPVLLSPADSPRNLSAGVALLLLLGAARAHRWLARQGPALAGARLVLAVLLAGGAAHGLGTVMGLHHPGRFPASTAVATVRREVEIARVLARAAPRYAGPYFAVDYSLAGSLAYLTRRPTYTSWEQFRIWGIPDLLEVTVVGLDLLPPELVTTRLAAGYAHVVGPDSVSLEGEGATGRLLFWRASGARWDRATMLHELDYLTLYDASRPRR